MENYINFITPLGWFCIICALYYIFGWTRPVLWFMHVLWTARYFLITVLLAVVVPSIQMYRSDDAVTHGNALTSVGVVVGGTLFAICFTVVFRSVTGQDKDD